MNILRRLMLLRVMQRRIDPTPAGARLLAAPGVYLTDENGNKLTG